jgi:hypothetical protein
MRENEIEMVEESGRGVAAEVPEVLAVKENQNMQGQKTALHETSINTEVIDGLVTRNEIDIGGQVLARTL